METVKTASFEYLIDLAKKNPDGGYTFVLDGETRLKMFWKSPALPLSMVIS